ncbi:MAG: recombinase family protein [Eubacteriales bacterium]|nr:recombinase family protein [Eubacteriales bacterium]
MARKSRKQQAAAAPAKELTGMKIWKAALYIRLSVEDKGDHGVSLETQQRIMENFAALHPEIQIVEIYTDNGVTGRTFERPAFQQMLRDADNGIIDCILVKDLSRLGRNTIDAGYYIEKYFPLHGIRFISVNDQFDSISPDNDGNHVILPLKNMINEAYAFDISRKVKAQQRQSMKSGEFVGARPPYGYEKAADNCHQLIVDEEAAPVVRQIFSWASEGVPTNTIARRLNESGILSPGYYGVSKGRIPNNRLAGNGKWQTWTVTKILTSEVYTGDMVQGKSKTVGHRQVCTNPEEWITVRGTHEALVSRELFQKVQAILEEKASKSAASSKVPYTENVLRGKIFCGHCGKNLHRQRSHEKYIFHCISNDRIAKDYCSGSPRLWETELFGSILTIIQKEAAVVMDKKALMQKADSKLAERMSGIDRQLYELRQRISRNQGFLKSLYQNFVTGVLTGSEFRSMKLDYEEAIQADMSIVRALEDEQKNLQSQMEQLSDLADRLEHIGRDTELTASLVNQLIERITVYDNDHIEIVFCFRNAFEQLEGVITDE